MQVAALKLLDGELMIIVTQRMVESAIVDYGKRWGIETLFGILKSRGFNLEGTHLREMERLSKLVALLRLAMLGAGEWVVIDNATFHHGGRITELIEAAGCKVIYLPPYSPDLNRIEKCWVWLKSRIRKQLRNSDNLRDAMETVLEKSSVLT